MRTNILRLIPDKATERTLRLMGDRVSALWNAANYVRRQAFVAHAAMPGYAKLCEDFKEHEAYRALPTHMGQEVLKKLIEAWESCFALREKWQSGALKDKPGLPRYRKHKDGTRPNDWIPVKSTAAYAVGPRHVALTLPADLRKKGRLQIPCRGLRRYVGPMKSADLLFDAGRGRWYIKYRVERDDNRPKPWVREAALDLGVRVAVSLSINGVGPSFNFLGRDLLKDWDYWGRKLSEHMSELSHRPKNQQSSKKLRRMFSQRGKRWEHAWEALSARIVAQLRNHKVGHLYIGWPKDIRRDKNYGKKWNGRIHNFWGFDKASKILERHCARAGIQTSRVLEGKSSSTCPECHSENVVRKPRHVLACRDCGFKAHSDQSGSRNLLRTQNPAAQFPNIPGPSRDRAEAAPKPETHRWHYHRWADASNPLSNERLAA
ncbi:MAG: hypothetical protein A2514_15925 [Gammaproteobacteria bacterium RIFOXYD12_FULL_61_37]|nr:MAG: hypothetical protein A2514_15925 [Gammaproteobacteria bacterium RIFOXYD12_FULL_61_37]